MSVLKRKINIKQICLLLFTVGLFANVSICQSQVIRVMSFNIHHGNPPEENGKIALDAIVKTIRESKATIVALQEVDVHTKRSGNINEAQILADQLGMYVFFAKAINYDDGEYGLAILSKYPLSDEKIYPLSLKADANAEPRILQTVTLTLPNQKKLKFANTHLDVLHTGNRELQAAEITAIAKTETLPMLIAGDWNATLGSKTLQIMDAFFTRTCITCPITCPEDGLDGAIDFIAFGKKSPFKILSYKVLEEVKASDHYPIIAELMLK